MTKTVLINKTYSSSKNVRPQIIETVTDTIQSLDLNTIKTCDEILLTVDEALTNAMEHGNKWDPAKNIHISITKNSTYLTITITDEGEGFPYKKLSNQKDTDTLKPRGRGLFLIKQFSMPNWNRKGNSIDLKFALKDAK